MEAQEKTIGFVGGGRVTRIILSGLSNSGFTMQKVMVSDVNSDVLRILSEKFSGIKVTSNNVESASADLVFLAVHPPVMRDVLPEISGSLRPSSVLVSLAPVFKIQKISSELGGFDRIARMIPNAPSAVNAGYNPIAFSPAVSEDDKSKILSIFERFGQAPIVDEDTLEIYAIITAMGPTYFWFQWAKLVEMAVSFGLQRNEAERAVASMLHGAVKTMFDSGMSVHEVMDLIPVKPLADYETVLDEAYQSKLSALFAKLRG